MTKIKKEKGFHVFQKLANKAYMLSSNSSKPFLLYEKALCH